MIRAAQATWLSDRSRQAVKLRSNPANALVGAASAQEIRVIIGRNRFGPAVNRPGKLQQAAIHTTNLDETSAYPASPVKVRDYAYAIVLASRPAFDVVLERIQFVDAS